MDSAGIRLLNLCAFITCSIATYGAYLNEVYTFMGVILTLTLLNLGALVVGLLSDLR